MYKYEEVMNKDYSEFLSYSLTCTCCVQRMLKKRHHADELNEDKHSTEQHGQN